MEKEQEKQLIQSCKNRLIRALANLDVKLNEIDLAYMGVILEDELKTMLTRCTTELPITSPNRFRLRANNGSIGGYHPIEGRWYQIYQVLDKEGRVRYYTNGIQETRNLDYSGELDIESSS